MRVSKAILIILTSFPVLGFSREIVVTVLSTNDLHGAVEGVQDPELAGTGRFMGGFARIAGMVQRLKGAQGPTVVVDAGDCFQGVMAVNASEGMPCVEYFDLVQYDAVALGNHEFDYRDCGPDDPTGKAEDPQCALKRAISAGKHPVVATNLLDAKTKEPPDWKGLLPYAIVDASGVKIGIAAVLTTDAAMVTNPGAMVGLMLKDPVKAVLDVVPRMRAEGAKVILVLAHLTGGCAGDKDATGPCKVTGDLGRLSKALKGHVDLIIAGHSHVYIAGSLRGVPVMEAMSSGRFIGRADVVVDMDGKKQNRVRVLPPIPVCHAEDLFSKFCAPSSPGFLGVAPEHPEVAMLVEKLRMSVMEACKEVVAVASTDILHYKGKESPLGNLTADLMRMAGGEEFGGSGPADIAFTNLGSIRDSIRAGPITVCDMHRVWPFEDPLVEVKMTGRELTELFRFITGKIRKMFAVSGMVISKPGQEAVLMDNSGRPLDMDMTYRVITTNYLVRGGDKVDTIMSRLPPDRFRILTYPSYREAFRRLLSSMKSISAPETGRIKN